MEYSRKVSNADGPAALPNVGDSRVMDFGTVFLLKDSESASTAPPAAGSQPVGTNIAELVIGRGFGTVIRHRDFDERSNYYNALLAAEARAISQRKGIHSAKDPPVMHVMDLLNVRPYHRNPSYVTCRV